MNDAEGIAIGGGLEEAAAVGGGLDLFAEPIGGRQRGIGAEGEHSDADLGSRGEESDAERRILGCGDDADESARFERLSGIVVWHGGDCAGEDPRVMPQEGTFAAGFQADDGQGIAHGRLKRVGGGIRKRPHRAALPRRGRMRMEPAVGVEPTTY